MLECLLSFPDHLALDEDLLERAWDEYTDPFTTAVKTTIRRLRTKLGNPPMIHTVREAGYRIEAHLMQLTETLLGLLHRQRPVLRVQLALLYSGVFIGLVVVLFAASSVLFGTA